MCVMFGVLFEAVAFSFIIILQINSNYKEMLDVRTSITDQRYNVW